MTIPTTPARATTLDPSSFKGTPVRGRPLLRLTGRLGISIAPGDAASGCTSGRADRCVGGAHIIRLRTSTPAMEP